MLPSLALASDDAFRIDAVFVSVFRSDDVEDEDRARAVERRLVELLAEQHLVVGVDEVEPFEDYSAETYLRACPLDRLAGCAYVIGERARADWAVDGYVTFLDEDKEAYRIESSIVDVARSRTVVTFEVQIDEGRGDTWASAVASMIDQLAAGGEPEDVRDRTDRTTELEDYRRGAVERAAIAEGLAALTAGLEQVDVRAQGAALRPTRVTAADLERLQQQESAPPWQRLGLTPAQYRRMRNRGMDADAFRDRLSGRAGRLLFRASLAGGLAPARMTYDGRWTVDPETQVVVGLEATNRIMQGSGFGGEVEVGIGLLSWIDVSLGLASRGGTHDWLVHAEATNRPREAPARTQVAASDLEGIARATLAPWPLGPVRPLASVGVSLWRGPSVGRMIDFSSVGPLEPPPVPTALRLRLGAGVEADLDRRIRLFGRVELLPQVGGLYEARQIMGDASQISDRDERHLRAGLGMIASAGLLVLTDPLWRRQKVRGDGRP